MPWFYVDDAFADSKPVIALDKDLRNEAVGLWTRCGAWSAKEETDGRVPLDIVKGFGGTPRLIIALHSEAHLWDEVEPELWRIHREILFKSWEKWQPTHQELEQERVESSRKRQADAERKRAERAAKNLPEISDRTRRGRKGRNVVISTNSDNQLIIPTNCPPGHNMDTERTYAGAHAPVPGPDPTRPLEVTHLGNEGSRNVGVERGLSDTVEPSASRLVYQIIPSEHPDAVKTMLRIRASELINTGTDPDVVAEALRVWVTKPSVGPGILPSLVSDVLKARAGANGAAPKNKLRAWAELAAKVRAEEQTQLTNPPKEIP